jgi:phosphonate transport system ATP-binding protein
MCSLHQVELALDYADRIVAMRGGQVIFDGRPDDLSAEWQRTIYDRPAGAGSAPHNEVGERVDADEVSSSPRIPVLNR